MEEINRFVTLARSGHFTVTDRCEQFGISRKTGYKHLERYAEQGLAGMQPDCSFHLLSEHGGGF
jgi:transposase